MDNRYRILIFAAIGVLAIGFTVWHYYSSRCILKLWANEEGFEILHSEYRHLFQGPFFWTPARGRAVYYVHVRDSHGVERFGYVRISFWFLGLVRDKTDVKWESEP